MFKLSNLGGQSVLVVAGYMVRSRLGFRQIDTAASANFDSIDDSVRRAVLE